MSKITVEKEIDKALEAALAELPGLITQPPYS
jgi:hypothetical protein